MTKVPVLIPICYQLLVIRIFENATSVPLRLTSMPTVPLVKELSLALPTVFPLMVKVNVLPLVKTRIVLILPGPWPCRNSWPNTCDQTCVQGLTDGPLLLSYL